MDLAKGIRAFISGREMILSLMVDTFIMVLNSACDELRWTYQDRAAVPVIFPRPAPRTRRQTGISLSITHSLLRFCSNVTEIRVISWLIASRSPLMLLV